MPMCTPRSLYKYFSRAGLLRFLRTRTIRFSPLRAFNDPFEATPTIDGLHNVFGEDLFLWERLQAALSISFGGNVGILCLSEDPLNILMWGHYCNAHQGGVVEFDATHEFFTKSKTGAGYHQYLRKVIYQEERVSLSVDHFRKNKMGLLNDHASGWLELVMSEHPILFTKSIHWAYELEWRLVRQLVDDCDPFSAKPKAAQIYSGHHVYEDYSINPAPALVELAKVPAECIKAVYLGARSATYTGGIPDFEEEVWRELSRRLMRRCKITINKVRFDPEKYGLIAFDLQDPDKVRENVSAHEFKLRLQGAEAVRFRNKT